MIFSIAEVPASSLVFLALIPCMLYSIMSFHGNHKWFLFIFTLLIFCMVSGLFVLMATGYSGEIGETVTMIGFLFALFFPYRLSTNLIDLLGAPTLFVISVIIIMICIIGWMIKLDEFKLAVAGSFFLAFFTSAFLIINIFFYLIPALQTWVLTSPGFNWIVQLFYGILPFLIFTVSMLWLVCYLVDKFKGTGKEKAQRLQDSQRINKQLGRSLVGSLSKWLIVFTLIILAIVIVACVILV